MSKVYTRAPPLAEGAPLCSTHADDLFNLEYMIVQEVSCKSRPVGGCTVCGTETSMKVKIQTDLVKDLDMPDWWDTLVADWQEDLKGDKRAAERFEECIKHAVGLLEPGLEDEVHVFHPRLVERGALQFTVLVDPPAANQLREGEEE